MKRFTYLLFIPLCLSLFACTSKDDKQLITITDSIADQLSKNNCEAAYNRMSEDYKLSISLARFEEEWKTFTSGDTCTSFKSRAVKTDTSAYKSFQTKFQFDKKTLYANFIFGKGALYPTGLKLSENKNLISSKNKKDGQTLRELSEAYFKIGSGIYGYNKKTCAINYPEYMDTLKTHFSSCTMTNLMKPSSILNQKKSKENLKNGIEEPYLDFSAIEDTLQWCLDNNVKMRGHTLVWHTQAPVWFFKENYDDKGNYVSREVMINRMDSMIKQYMEYCQTKFPGVVYCWDVVNEAVDPTNGDKNSPFRCRIMNDKERNNWYFTIGADYPRLAFISARKYAAPGVALFYNDYGTTDKSKRECIYKLCKSLKEEGLIDGIGMQAYWDNRNPTLKTIADTINYYAELGLEIQLTEWSMNADAYNERGLETQAERYASIFRLLQKLDTQGGGKANITCVSTFGVMDGYPLYSNDKTSSRFFDKDLNPKPVFHSVKETLQLFY